MNGTRAGQIALGLLVVAATAALVGRVTANAPPGHYTSAGGTVYDTSTKLTWQQAVPLGFYTWSEATTYCASLALSGSGWRLPSVTELQTIVDEGSTYPSIDQTWFPGTPSQGFWTSSPYAGSPSSAWYVAFAEGFPVFNDVSLPVHARCVR